MLSGTADMAVRYCPSCSQPEHGTLACDFGWAWGQEPPPRPERRAVYRIMDDQLFEVHPGSPLGPDDHCCLCAYRRRKA
ncbi:hypothetical protein LCGC14_2172770 [marine sediment metagenome]|uniref:Uncharacterized protein n=1 Tax=marine sediment metagenome TaxID=412755 RepID=A0A0F9DPG5_9ZZZZ